MFKEVDWIIMMKVKNKESFVKFGSEELEGVREMKNFYKTISGLRAETIEIMESVDTALRLNLNLVKALNAQYEKELKYERNRVFVFRPWKIFKKRKNVGN